MGQVVEGNPDVVYSLFIPYQKMAADSALLPTSESLFPALVGPVQSDLIPPQGGASADGRSMQDTHAGKTSPTGWQ